MLSSADLTSCCLLHNCGKSCTFRYYKPPLSILSNNRPTLIHCSFRPSPPSSAPITRQENGKLVQLFVKGGKRDPGFHFANWLPQQLGGITWSAGISAMKEAAFQFWNPTSSLPQAASVKSSAARQVCLLFIHLWTFFHPYVDLYFTVWVSFHHPWLNMTTPLPCMRILNLGGSTQANCRATM